MREIKFRAWHNTAEKYLQHGSNRQIFSWQDEGQDITIEQYTGLKDRNGVEIYEGDVIDYAKYIDMVVVWVQKFASFGLRKEGWMFTHFFGEAITDPALCTVIGNIHTKTDSNVQP